MTKKLQSPASQETLIRITEEWKEAHYGLRRLSDKDLEKWGMHISWLITEMWRLRVDSIPHIHINHLADHLEMEE